MLSQRRTAKQLEEEQKEILGGGGVYPTNALRMRYRHNKPRVGQNDPPIYDTYATFSSCSLKAEFIVK